MELVQGMKGTMHSKDANSSPRQADLLTIPEVAKRLSCSERHIWRLVRDKEIEVFRHRGLTRITARALERFIQMNQR
jgi:excisionase family DNA binding protein